MFVLLKTSLEPSRVRSRTVTVTLALCVAALLGATFAASASAARLPKKSELKWIDKEFKANPKDDGAVISLIRVSSVNPRWAAVQYFPKSTGSGGGVVACAATECGPTGVKAKQRLEKKGKRRAKAPEPVKKDFAEPFLVHIFAAVNQGQEKGSSTFNCGDGTVTRELRWVQCRRQLRPRPHRFFAGLQQAPVFCAAEHAARAGRFR
jgi:hypothetical protein